MLDPHRRWQSSVSSTYGTPLIHDRVLNAAVYFNENPNAKFDVETIPHPVFE